MPVSAWPAILAFDVDGTVLGANDRPVPGIAETLRELAEAGVKLVPSTGRPLYGALRAAGVLGVTPSACVAYHGALVVDLEGGRVLRHLTVPDGLAARVALAGLAGGLQVSLYVGDERRDLPADWVPPVVTPPCVPPPVVTPPGVRPPVVTFAGPDFGVTRLVLAGDPRRVTLSLPELDEPRRAGLRIEQVRPGVVVVLPGAADKGDGLRLVAAHFGVLARRVVAAGDDLNDITLLLASGHALAVGDALPALRAVAGETVAQDGLAAALRDAFRRLG